MKERDLERHFVREVKRLGWEVRKLIFDGHAGAPDRICIGPGGRVAFAELKRPNGGRVSPLQERELRILCGLGHTARVIRDEEDVVAFLKELA